MNLMKALNVADQELVWSMSDAGLNLFRIVQTGTNSGGILVGIVAGGTEKGLNRPMVSLFRFDRAKGEFEPLDSDAEELVDRL